MDVFVFVRSGLFSVLPFVVRVGLLLVCIVVSQMFHFPDFAFCVVLCVFVRLVLVCVCVCFGVACFSVFVFFE